MENKIKLASIQDCTGCRACADVCPKGCISFSEVKLHHYPRIDSDKCIKCGICMKTCPILNPCTSRTNHAQIYYAAWNNDNHDRATSTSGGAASLISSWAQENGYHICGAAFDVDWKLSHVVTNDKAYIHKFKQSKYLQSDTINVFREILKLLRNGEKVLFVGTPCQIAGLHAIVPLTLRTNLLTIDIICHGVNSPKVWGDYVKYLEGWHRSKLSNYNFRDKINGWQRPRGGQNLSVSMKFANGQSVRQRAIYNLFHNWFGKHYILRPSCINCHFRTPQRQSDITIGDFWNIEKILPQVDTFRGVSAVIANTQKGEEAIDNCGLTKIKVDSEAAIKILRGYVDRKSPETKAEELGKMRAFCDFYETHSFSECAQRYPVPTKMNHFFKRVRFFLKIK